MIDPKSTELTTEQSQACKDAVLHVLRVICDDPRKFYLMGDMTGAYEKLTLAAALVWGEPVDDIRKNFRPESREWERYCEERKTQERLLRYCQDNGITGADQ